MRLFFVPMVLVCFSAAMFAQSTNDQQIAGVVKDSSGASVPNATVTATNPQTHFSRAATSNDSGGYTLAQLPIGVYNITTAAGGFKTDTLTSVNLQVNAKLTVNPTLQVGNVSENITVQSDAVRVESDTGEVSHVITGEQATQLQLNGRNFVQLLALVPGVSTINNSGFSLFGGYGSNMSNQSVNGSRTDTFSWNLDGADNKDNGGGGNNFVNINPDAIAEFSILTSNYSAEYGGSSGAVINIALKSGTSEFHGIGYEYFRNNAIQARAFNASTTPELRYNNFGWNLGGPIYIPGHFNKNKDKLFFFVGEDFKRLRSGTLETWNVPTLLERGGNFSQSTVKPVDPTTKQPFTGNVIPGSLINPNSQRLVENYPAPNFTGAGGNYVLNYVAPLNANEYIYKVDYNLSSRNQLNFHYVRDYYTSEQNQDQLITYNRDIPGTNTSLQWTFVANPTTVNIAQLLSRAM